MSNPIIHFAHANGFPSGTYTSIFEQLAEVVQYRAIDCQAQRAEYPIRREWLELADELIENILLTCDQPIIGVGHSFGASLTFLAAVKRPDLFRALMLIEPVHMSGIRKWITILLRLFNATDFITPARFSKDRRDHWPDLETARTYFNERALFQAFDKQCFENYLRHGLVNTDNGYELKFKVEHEVAIYRTTPLNFSKYKGQLNDMPGVIIAADKTNVAFPEIVNRFAAEQHFEIQTISGSHLFPLEQPAFTADLIKKYVAKFS